MDVVNFLQSFLPQYVLGVLPAMAILGSSPEDSCMSKFLYFFYSLGSPFRGLFYYINVNNNKLEMSSYWLEPENFDLNGKNPAYKPFGIHAKKIKQINITPEQQEITDDCAECVAKTSILDKVTSFVSICYIILGVISALGRITGSCVKEDWPYIPLALVWTLPAVIKRIWGGMLVVHDPAKNFLNNTTNGQDNHRLIPLENYNRTQRHNRYIRVALTALISIIVPWFSVALAYFTPPKGYFCRSQYLTILCSIWTFNSLITLIFHIKGENNHKIRLCLNIINALSGLVVLVLLIILVLLSLSTSLWIKFGGEHCSIDSACLEG